MKKCVRVLYIPQHIFLYYKSDSWKKQPDFVIMTLTLYPLYQRYDWPVLGSQHHLPIHNFVYMAKEYWIECPNENKKAMHVDVKK